MSCCADQLCTPLRRAVALLRPSGAEAGLVLQQAPGSSQVCKLLYCSLSVLWDSQSLGLHTFPYVIHSQVCWCVTVYMGFKVCELSGSKNPCPQRLLINREDQNHCFTCKEVEPQIGSVIYCNHLAAKPGVNLLCLPSPQCHNPRVVCFPSPNLCPCC